MAVIINELEVVLEPPQPAPQAGGQAVPQMPMLSPHDILTIIERERRMRLRVEAH